MNCLLYPLALFNESRMKKYRKSALYTLFKEIDKDIDFTTLECRWETLTPQRYLANKKRRLCQPFVMVMLNFGKPIIMAEVVQWFSMGTSESTKAAKHSRRYSIKRRVDIKVSLKSEIKLKERDFLSNFHNKSQLINLLMIQLQNEINRL